jgi:1-acyl-sn-glycerol-3-phosphate acyltransferase
VLHLVERMPQMHFHDAGYGYDIFGLHPPSVERLLRWMSPWYRHYFRVTSEGFENVPAEGGAILVANHGAVLPIDAALLWADVNLKTGRFLRMIADRFVPRLPVLSSMFARAGVVSGTRTNVQLLLEREELVAIFPEGTTGPAKPASRRYELQDWRVGHAELALEYRVPIIPIAIVGAEESWPLWFKIPVRAFGSPYLPMPKTPVPLPIQIRIQYGTPITVDTPLRTVDAVTTPARVEALAARTRDAVDRLISRARS